MMIALNQSIQTQVRTIAAHFTWEDAADQYAAFVTSWWAGGYRDL
jgi:hypothetical protein